MAVTLSIGGIAALGFDQAIAGTPSAVITAGATSFLSDCGNVCRDLCGDGISHKNYNGASNYGPYHECETYSDFCPHPTCGTTLRSDSLAKVVAAIDPSDGKALAAFLQDPLVQFNAERSALQFVGCDGAIVAQVSVSSAALSAVIAAAANN